MSHEKVNDLQKQIKFLEQDKAYINSTISYLIAEQIQIDNEIELLTVSGIAIDKKIADLKAELADTI